MNYFIKGMFLVGLVCFSAPGAPNSPKNPAPSEKAEKRKLPEKNKTSEEEFGFQSLLLKGGETCVVNDVSGNKCLLTAEDYNRKVFTLEMVSSGAFMQSAGKYRADSTRYLAMRAILFNLYKEQKLQSAGLDTLLDSVSADACQEAAIRGDTALTGRLVKYYNAHYAADFKTRRVPVFNIIAGSDSAYIHSIFKLLERQNPYTAARAPGDTAARRLAMERLDSLPWRRATMDDLGPASSMAAKTLGHFQWSSPIWTPYGYTIFWLVDSTWTREIFLPSVQDSLRLVLKGQDETFLTQAKSYYRSNRQQFPMPDTLSFKLALCPDSSCMSNPGLGKTFPVASEYSMPASTRAVLKSAYNSRRPDSAWVETPLGFARMVAPKVRRGKGSRPFDEVKAEIFKSIDAPADSSVFESVKCMQARRRVADLFVPYLYQDVAALLHEHNVQPGQKTHDPVLRGSIKEARTRFRGDFKSWMEGLAVQLPVP